MSDTDHEQIERGIASIGEFDIDNCTCDASVGFYPCHYCAEREAILAGKRVLERLAAAEAEIVNAREAARLVFHKATFIGTAKEHNRFPGWQKIAEMYTWLAQQEDDTAAKGG